MAENYKRLRAAGGLANWFATALTIAGTNWGVLVSGVAGFVAFIWTDGYKVASDPHVQIGASVFLWVLWTYIALSLLYRVHHGIKTIPMVEYPHSIFVESMSLAYDKDSEDAALQINMMFRNVAAGPIKIEVIDFRVIIEGRTIPESPVITIIAPRISPKAISSGSFAKEVIKGDRANGTISVIFHYGPPDGPCIRKYCVKANIHLRVGEQVGLGNQITFDEDSPL